MRPSQIFVSRPYLWPVISVYLQDIEDQWAAVVFAVILLRVFAGNRREVFAGVESIGFAGVVSLLSLAGRAHPIGAFASQIRAAPAQISVHHSA